MYAKSNHAPRFPMQRRHFINKRAAKLFIWYQIKANHTGMEEIIEKMVAVDEGTHGSFPLHI